MKIRTILYFAFILPFFLSCSKDNGGDNPQSQPEPLPLRKVVLSADFSPVKITLDEDNGPVWEVDDKVAVFSQEGSKFIFHLTEGAGTKTAKFEGEMSGTPIVSVYPADYAEDYVDKKVVYRIPDRFVVNNPAESGLPGVLIAEVLNGQMSFLNTGSVMKATFTNVPAYARSLVLTDTDETLPLTGKFTIIPNEVGSTDPVVSGENGKQITVCFPYKSTELTIYVPVTSGLHTINAKFYDADGNFIEGCVKNMSSTDFPRASLYSLRSAALNPLRNYVAINGVRWAKGNLFFNSSSKTSGWVDGWGLYDKQWDFAGSDKTGSSGDGISVQDSDKRYDHFNWGGIALCSYQTDSVLVYPNGGTASGTKVAYFSYIWTRSNVALDIQGKTFRYQDGTSEREFDYSLIGGTGKGAPYFFYSGNNDGTTHPKTWATGGSPATVKTFSSYYGDVASWASKGVFTLPDEQDFNVLLNLANYQAGYYEEGGNRSYGVLFTSCPAGESRVTSMNEIRFDAKDVESGLFLPLAGYRKPVKERTLDVKCNFETYTPTSSKIDKVSELGAYWSSNQNSDGSQFRSPVILRIQGGAIKVGANLSDTSISVFDSRTVHTYSTPTGLSIRPVMAPVDPGSQTGELVNLDSESINWD